MTVEGVIQTPSELESLHTKYDSESMTRKFSSENLTGDNRGFVSSSLSHVDFDLEKLCSMSYVYFDNDGQQQTGSFFETVKESDREKITDLLLDVINAIATEKEKTAKVLAEYIENLEN